MLPRTSPRLPPAQAGASGASTTCLEEAIRSLPAVELPCPSTVLVRDICVLLRTCGAYARCAPHARDGPRSSARASVGGRLRAARRGRGSTLDGSVAHLIHDLETGRTAGSAAGVF